MPDVTESYGMRFNFIRFFTKNWLPFISEVFFFTKLSQIVCLMHTLWYVDMSDVAINYGRFSGLLGFFGNFNFWYVILFI